MAEGDGALYYTFKERVMEGTYNLATGGNTIKVTLHTGYTPNVSTHAVWADVSATEYSTAGNYTAGGKTLANQDVTISGASGKFDADDVTWTSLLLSPTTPSHAILWDDTPAGDPLMGYWTLGTTATNGGNYTLQFGANGIITLT